MQSNIISKRRLSLWTIITILLYLLLLMPLTVSAVTNTGLQFVGTNVEVDNNALNIVLSVKNISKNSLEFKYGVRVQSETSKGTYEVPIGELFLQATQDKIVTHSVKLPDYITGKNEVYIISRDEGGLINTLQYAGSVIIEQGVVNASKSTDTLVTIESCEKLESTVVCRLTGAKESEKIDIQYKLHAGSLYGNEFSRGVKKDLLVAKDTVSFTLNAVPSGIYTYSFWINDNVNARHIVAEYPEDIYKNKRLVESPTQAIESTQEQEAINIKEIFMDNVFIIIFLLPIIILSILVYVAMRRPKIMLYMLVAGTVLTSAVAIAATTLTDDDVLSYIFNGLSQDSQNTQFLITLDQDGFESDQSLALTAVMQDATTPNDKPSTSSLEMQVDSGSWESVIALTDSNSFYHRTFGVLAAGDHTLNFRSSGNLCGSAFNFSLFDTAIFGTTECLFSMPLTVTENSAPTTPVITGDCTLGEACQIDIISTDTGGGSLCYDISLDPHLTTESAGCNTSGTPVSINKTFYECTTLEPEVRAVAEDSSDLQSLTGIGAPNITGTINCTKPCSHCTNDGTAGDSAISALPIFIPADGGTVDISWSLTNVQTCVVTGVDDETGSTIDTWDWDTVRQNQTMETSFLTDTAIYTMSCTDYDGLDLQSSVTISNLPSVQEF